MCDPSTALSMRELSFDACPTGLSAIDQMGKVKIQSYRACSGPVRRNTDLEKSLKDIRMILDRQHEMDAWKANTLAFAEASRIHTQQRQQAAIKHVKIPAFAAQKPTPAQAADPQPAPHKRHRHKRH